MGLGRLQAKRVGDDEIALYCVGSGWAGRIR